MQDKQDKQPRLAAGCRNAARDYLAPRSRGAQTPDSRGVNTAARVVAVRNRLWTEFSSICYTAVVIACQFMLPFPFIPAYMASVRSGIYPLLKIFSRASYEFLQASKFWPSTFRALIVTGKGSQSTSGRRGCSDRACQLYRENLVKFLNSITAYTISWKSVYLYWICVGCWISISFY